MMARSEDNIQKLVAGGSEAIIQQRDDTDSTENEQETFLIPCCVQ